MRLALLFLTYAGGIFSQQTAAIAEIYPVKGSEVHGTVTFAQTKKGVRVVAKISGLSPGNHGFHLHEYGNCTGCDASAAGGHFNPTNQKHGCLNSKEHHVGDLGNIKADRKGYGKYDRTIKALRLEGSESIIGRSVVIHENEDDCITQPTGNSGARVGCGVIGIAKPHS